MRKARLTLVVSLAVGVLAPHLFAQSLTFSVFERYLESLRQQALIPGLSGAIVQDGELVWERGFGMANLETSLPAAPFTPYPIADLSQTLASTLLLERCVDDGHLGVNDRVLRWLPKYPEADTSVSQLLRHISTTGTFSYSPSRYATVSDIIEECARGEYPQLIADQILERLAMFDSAPSEEIDSIRPFFSALRRERYGAVLARVAVPYRLDRGRPVRSDYKPKSLNASAGVVSTARDLAQYDESLDSGLLLEPGTRTLAWTGASGVPTGLGWFVQRYNNELVVWHLGFVKDAYSSLIVKVPNRHLTIILLANSDGLGSASMLTEGDVTKSLFATVFLRLAVP